MIRHAAHFILYNKKIYRQHYLELDDKACLKGVFPLYGELFGTIFHSGIVFVVPVDSGWNHEQLSQELNELTGGHSVETVLDILDRLNLPDLTTDCPINVYLILYSNSKKTCNTQKVIRIQ